VNYTEIEAFISTNRLNSYRTLAPGGNTEELIGAYYWNKALCGALYPVLQCVEITLRNAIHQSASTLFSTTAWYDRLLRLVGDEVGLSSGWFDANGRRIKKTTSERNLQKAKDVLINAGKRASPPGVVSELSFGFLGFLLNSQFEDIPNRTKLWPNLLINVFPNAPAGQRSRNNLYHKFARIRRLRNRISHHEPLWKSLAVNNNNDAIAYLSREYQNVIEAIGYMSNDRKNYLQCSLMCREFERLCTIESLLEYTGENKKQINQHEFKKDLGRYLNLCNKKNVTIYLKSNKGHSVRIVAN
jgi:hypothetical protein